MSNPYQFTKVVAVQKAQGPSKLANNAVVEVRKLPALQPGQILLKMGAVAFNHRDVKKQTHSMQLTHDHLVLDSQGHVSKYWFWQRLRCGWRW